MTPTPRLRGKRLALQPFKAKHLSAEYVSWLNDPEVVRFSEQRHKKHTLKSCRAYVASFAGTPHHLWAIVSEEFGHIGNLAATVDPANRVADLAILIGKRECWSQGFGAEAWTVAMQWLLGKGGMRKVTAGTMANNRGMLSVMKKAGMREEGRRRKHFVQDGRAVDLVMVARFRR